MRITMQTINNNILSNINKITTDMATLNDQISSGRQMSKLSDNPVNLTVALSLRTNLNEITQYQENLSYGQNKIDAAESSLTQIKEQIIRAKELAIQAANGTMTQENRALLAPEVGHLFEQAITLGNTQINGQYIFGGYRTTGYTETEPAPFIADKYDGYRLNGNTFSTIDQNAPPAPLPTLSAGDISVNGVDIAATVADGTGLPYEDMSATAVAKVINDISDQTGVTANIIPAQLQGNNITGSGAATLDAGDLTINGFDIFPVADFPTGATISANDSDNTLINAINAKSNDTGVIATNNGGQLVLSAMDGRNIRIQTSDDGETFTGLPDAGSSPDDVVYFGAIQLKSDEKFQIKTADGSDTDLGYIGLGGGTANTGEPDDTAGDGEIWVRAIANRDDSVRYTGDRNNDLEIKVSKGSTLAVTKRGNEAISDTGVFAATKRLESALLGKNFTEVTSVFPADNTGSFLNEAASGLPDYEDIVTGSFAVTVTDHDYYPPQEKTITINVNPATDTMEAMMQKLNGVPGLNAAWDADNQLELQTTDPDRYTFSLGTDTSNYLRVIGIDQERMQVHAIENSIGEMNQIMDNLSNQISDFGARANRIEIQQQILTNMELSTTESLSDMQDTDITDAILHLKTKEFAYQAALSAAAKTMQLSLVNFL